jgi:hypothetical protein
MICEDEIRVSSVSMCSELPALCSWFGGVLLEGGGGVLRSSISGLAEGNSKLLQSSVENPQQGFQALRLPGSLPLLKQESLTAYINMHGVFSRHSRTGVE